MQNGIQSEKIDLHHLLHPQCKYDIIRYKLNPVCGITNVLQI
jgi:hypothetical protein